MYNLKEALQYGSWINFALKFLKKKKKKKKHAPEITIDPYFQAAVLPILRP